MVSIAVKKKPIKKSYETQQMSHLVAGGWGRGVEEGGKVINHTSITIYKYVYTYRDDVALSVEYDRRTLTRRREASD